MDYLIHKLLEKREVECLRQRLNTNKEDWEDGRKTAGSQAALVKSNLQLNKSSLSAVEHSEFVTEKIIRDPLVKSFCLPRKVHGVIFSKTKSSQGYGMHVDNAYMPTGRSDISFTLFINAKGAYGGGELCIQTNHDIQNIKLDEGEAIFYPSTSLHAVNKVLSGERLACVGWIQSYISSNEERNILFGLDAGAKGLLAKYGKTPEIDLIFQSYNNLLRRLGD